MNLRTFSQPPVEDAPRQETVSRERVSTRQTERLLRPPILTEKPSDAGKRFALAAVA
jgi:hypothetical protein